MPDKTLLKSVIKSSLIFGAILGLLPLIPQLTGIMFIIIMFCVSPFIICKNETKSLMKLEMQGYLIIGAICGFVSFIGFSCVYFPLAWILYLILNIDSFLWIKVIFANIGYLIPMVIFIALLSALMNTFSAFLMVHLYGKIKDRG